MSFGLLSRALRGGSWVVLIMATCISVTSKEAVAATLTGVRHSTSAERTRIVIDVSEKATYSHRVLADPARVVVDLPESGVGPDVKVRAIQDGFVKQVRLNELRSGRVQVVVDLEKVLDYSTFTLDKPDRIVVDIKHPPKPSTPEPTPVTKAETTKTEPKKTEQKTTTPKETAPKKDPPKETPAVSKKVESPPPSKKTEVSRPKTETTPPPIEFPIPPHGEWVVAIDAGHGGDDHGARYHDTSEKDITLALAKELKGELEKHPGIRVILVRKGDYFIPLRRRWTLAEKQGANLFVSIHCNASKNRKAEGTEVYFLSLKGATNEAAQDLAQRENAVDQKMGVQVAEDDLNQIIFDMMQTDVLSKSEMLAEVCLEHLFELGTVYSRGVKQAGFAVLKSPRMPSILVEAAFLSNRKENKMLRDSGWRQEFASKLAGGLGAYIGNLDPAMKAER